MSNVRYDHAQTVGITAVQTGETVQSEILSFKPKHSLSVSINRQIKLVLRYNNINHRYEGHAANMQFVSHGPEQSLTKQGRRG